MARNQSGKPRSVYKRAGIIHICFKGALFAPESATNARPGKKDVITTVFDTDVKPPRWVEVALVNGGTVECWFRIEIDSKRQKTAKAKEEAVAENTRELGELEANAAKARARSRKAKKVRGNIFDLSDEDCDTNEQDVKAAIKDLSITEDSSAVIAIQAVAPNAGAAEVLMVAWSNWQNGARGGKKHPFEGFNYVEKSVTEKVRALGAALVMKGVA